ncbi:DUF6134 family protein [Flavobacteriaceae bacterium SZ-1-7]|uniref:DUF6134 family protein n=1 Tax=Tamlana sedimenti TaxID=3134126 RepID=UPI0031263FB5
MIPALILYLFKKFRKMDIFINSLLNFKKIALKLKSVFFLLAILASLSFTDKSINKALTYNVVKNDKVIGTIEINKNAFTDSTVYNLKSRISAKFLFKFCVTGKEKSVFKNGVLVYSSVHRTLNNKTKVNHKIVLKNGQYNLLLGGENIPSKIGSINRNLITLYFSEPIGVTAVFCDNLKKMVPIRPLGNGEYRVDFEDGKHNIFHYNNGTCVKVEAVSKFFNVVLIPA